MELKHIDFASKKFTANGKEYYIEDSFSIERGAIFDRLQIEASYQTTPHDIFLSFGKILNFADQGLMTKVVITAYNAQCALKNLAENDHPALRLCALFCNTKDEDRKTITDAQINEKINDWKTEGIARDDFFSLALSTMKGTWADYEQIFQRDSEVDPKPQR